MRGSLALLLVVVACGRPSEVARPPSDAAALEREALLESLDAGEENEVIAVIADGPARDAALPDMLDGQPPSFTATNLPVIAVKLSSREAYMALASRPGIVSLEPNRRHVASDATTNAVIGQPAAFSRGADGKGVAIAIIDTGADYTHADLGGCTAPGASCPVVFARDFAPEDQTRDGPVPHGTNVTAIAHAVAPAAKLIALDVFEGQYASTTTILAAIDWVIAQRTAYNIVAANFSLGYGAFTQPCANDALAVALQRLRAAGVLPVVAAGNDGYSTALGSPACAPAAVSVGAVDNTSAVASFSNAASFLTVLAPGVSVRGGGVVMSGTSQATPHAAAALAVLRSYFAPEGPTGAVDRLRRTGVRVTDARNQLAFPRIDLAAATGGAKDTTPPTGSIQVTTRYARTPVVGYQLSANDPSGVAEMCLSLNTTCSSFVAFAPNGTVTLPSGDGDKVLRAWLRDGVGNTTTQSIGATVTLDTQAPKDGTVTANATGDRVDLSFAGFTDATSGIARYRVVMAKADVAPRTCDEGTLVGEPTTPSVTTAGLQVGATYRYRVCAIDRAGNRSPGAVVSAIVKPESTPPTNATIALAGGAAWTARTTVEARLSAQDASGVASMCVSTEPTCSAWVPYATTVQVVLQAGSGVRTVYALFRDVYGNTTPTPVSATIRIDTDAPPPPVVRATVSPTLVTLSFADVQDVAMGSGTRGYFVATMAGTIPSTCSGAPLLLIDKPGLRQIAVKTTTPIGYRICAVDVLGNVSIGASGATATPTTLR